MKEAAQRKHSQTQYIAKRHARQPFSRGRVVERGQSLTFAGDAIVVDPSSFCVRILFSPHYHMWHALLAHILHILCLL